MNGDDFSKINHDKPGFGRTVRSWLNVPRWMTFCWGTWSFNNPMGSTCWNRRDTNPAALQGPWLTPRVKPSSRSFLHHLLPPFRSNHSLNSSPAWSDPRRNSESPSSGSWNTRPIATGPSSEKSAHFSPLGMSPDPYPMHKRHRSHKQGHP
jgi:hypothetical protein